MSRIEERLEQVAARKEKSLALFLTAGFPELSSTADLLPALEEGGADLIEIGMPFSDPLADGPVIQQSSMKALKNGVTLRMILEEVERFRKGSDLPLVLMGYLTPILRFGAEAFISAASQAGVDGIIFPELPLEEGETYRAMLRSAHLANILLVAPTTSPARIKTIDQVSEGFLYCVSATGVTGLDSGNPVVEYLRRVKEQAHKNRVLVGFGISTPAQAREFAAEVDGVVVGSALLRRLESGESVSSVRKWVKEMKAGLK